MNVFVNANLMLLLITLQDILFTSYRFVLTKFCMKNLDFKLIIFFLQISTVKPSIYFRYRQVHKNRIQNHFLSSFSFCIPFRILMHGVVLIIFFYGEKRLSFAACLFDNKKNMPHSFSNNYFRPTLECLNIIV